MQSKKNKIKVIKSSNIAAVAVDKNSPNQKIVVVVSVATSATAVGGNSGGLTAGTPTKSTPGSSSSSGIGRKARGGGVVQSDQPPGYQVEGLHNGSE